MKILFLISLPIIPFLTSCEGNKNYLEKIESEDVIVNLNISEIDPSVSQLYFYFFGQNRMVELDLDTLAKYDGIRLGYAAKEESVYGIRMVFENDTINREFFAEVGERPKLNVRGREIGYE